MIDYWITDFTRLSQEQYFCVQPAAPIQPPSEFDPWGEADEDRVPSGPPSIDMDQIRWKVEKELKEYRGVPRLDMRVAVEDGSKGDFIDPLKWWKTHALTFPTLSVIARNYLCIPATAALSERVFSVAGLTISKQRSKLNSENASCLIFLRDNWDVYEEIKASTQSF